MSSVETLSPSLISTGAVSARSTGRPSGTGLMFGPFRTSTAGLLGVRDGRDDQPRPPTRSATPGQLALGRDAGLRGSVIRAGERGGGRGQRRAEVDRVVAQCRCGPGKLRLNAAGCGRPGRHVADARARPAGGLGDAGPGGQQVASRPSRAITSRIRWLPGKTTKVHDGRDALALDDARHRLHVLPRGVGAGADHDLLDRLPSTSATGTTAVRRAGQRDQRLDRVEVELDAASSYSASGVGPSGRHSPRARGGGSTRGSPRRTGRRWSSASSSAPMLQMVARSRQRERRRARARRTRRSRPLPPLDRVAAQQLQDHVLAATHGRSRPVSHTRRPRGIVRSTARRPWPPPRRGRRRRWRACRSSRRAGCGCRCRAAISPGHAERLEVHLVADAVTGLGEPRAVAARRGLQIAVVVGVARVHLVDVVVDVGDRPAAAAPAESPSPRTGGTPSRRWCR